MSPEKSAVISPLVLSRQSLSSQHATALSMKHTTGALLACCLQAPKVESVTTLIRQRAKQSPGGTGHTAAMLGGTHRSLADLLAVVMVKGEKRIDEAGMKTHM